jgi:predicted TIM-barrel fold metal-dependent hydrolase
MASRGLGRVYPDRLIPMQLPRLADPQVAAAEIDSNAEYCRVVSFPDAPHHLGLPGVSSSYSDPFWAACQETGTVIALHVGASGKLEPEPSPGNSELVSASLFSVSSMGAAMDWTYSGVLTRFPRLRIALSEGGIGWVNMLLDRLDYISSRAGQLFADDWTDSRTPAEVLLDSFWFCTLDDPSALADRHRIGIDHIMVETDYPHGDSLWPHRQDTFHSRFRDLPADDVDKITYGNASALFGHQVPANCWPEQEGSASVNGANAIGSDVSLRWHSGSSF